VETPFPQIPTSRLLHAGARLTGKSDSCADAVMFGGRATVAPVLSC
jgi:hypothetical protein